MVEKAVVTGTDSLLLGRVEMNGLLSVIPLRNPGLDQQRRARAQRFRFFHCVFVCLSCIRYKNLITKDTEKTNLPSFAFSKSLSSTDKEGDVWKCPLGNDAEVTMITSFSVKRLRSTRITRIESKPR